MLKNLYSKVGVWKNRSELTSYLANSCVLYRDHGLLVINKPFNLGISPSTQNEFSLPEIIPELKDILQLPYLDYISSPERFSTGLLILGTTPESKNLVKRAKNRSKSYKLLHQSYLTLTDGFPRINNKFETIDSYKYAYSGTKSVEPVLTRNLYSKTKLKSSKSLLRYYLFTETLVKSSLGQSALVCVSPSSIENHFIQLYMSDLLSPVLGDFLYSYRVNSINGYPTKVSHTSSPPNKVQKLSPWILNALGFNPGEEYILPKHIHKYRIILKQFISGKDDLVLVAPPPDYFMETCNALKVSFDNIKLPIREHYIEPKSKEIEPLTHGQTN
uniref:RNA pseudouridylate synthase domaincontaining protein 3like [Saccoglossus kowalevskii] n=1 Tax=Lepeophtheirus salmonis TaxID=72036 RepID=A0A0K2U114_LEPSM